MVVKGEDRSDNKAEKRTFIYIPSCLMEIMRHSGNEATHCLFG